MTHFTRRPDNRYLGAIYRLKVPPFRFSDMRYPIMRPYHCFKRLSLPIATVMAGLLPAVQPLNADSKGIVVESVNEFDDLPGCGGSPTSSDICNSIANGDGFLQNMVFPGSPFFRSARWVDEKVYDTDFVDSQIDPLGFDMGNFDKPGTAISYLTAHGIIPDGCSPQARCTSTNQCRTPNTAIGQRFPASCRFSPMDPPRCCYMVDRAAVVNGENDRFSGLVNYTGGPIRWGESPEAGGWAGAGIDGGTNVVVLDISHPVLPTFWYPTFRNAVAGVQLILALMTAGGDTANVAQRGSTFAKMFRANQAMKVSDAWKKTMPSMPANVGQPCPGGGGFRGFNGCGCHIVIGFDKTRERADQSMLETFGDIRNDNNDALGNQFSTQQWQCNYPFSATDQTAWEKP